MKFLIKIMAIVALFIASGEYIHAMSKDAPAFVPSAPTKEWVQGQLANLIWIETFYPYQLQQALTQYNTKQLEGIIDELSRIWQTPSETLRFIKSLNIGEEQFNVLFVEFREKLLKAINSQQTKQLGSAIPKVVQSEEEQIRRAIELSLQEQKKQQEAQKPVFLYSNQSDKLVTLWIPRDHASWYPLDINSFADFDKSYPPAAWAENNPIIINTSAGQFWIAFTGTHITLSKKAKSDTLEQVKSIRVGPSISVIINPDGSINLSERK